tara:strand:+ start:2910 stop:3089 length:180 start_codon:yes stop_codon:yes gene_type:complete
MSHQLIDLYRNKILGTYATLAAAERALTHVMPEDGRYEIKSPKVRKPRAKKANVEQESN